MIIDDAAKLLFISRNYEENRKIAANMLKIVEPNYYGLHNGTPTKVYCWGKEYLLLKGGELFTTGSLARKNCLPLYGWVETGKPF